MAYLSLEAGGSDELQDWLTAPRSHDTPVMGPGCGDMQHANSLPSIIPNIVVPVS